jgi:hypothetical protein
MDGAVPPLLLTIMARTGITLPSFTNTCWLFITLLWPRILTWPLIVCKIFEPLVCRSNTYWPVAIFEHTY